MYNIVYFCNIAHFQRYMYKHHKNDIAVLIRANKAISNYIKEKQHEGTTS